MNLIICCISISFLKFLQNPACSSVTLSACASYLEQNQNSSGVQLTATGQLFPINLQAGYNNISFTQTILIPQWSILGLSQAGTYGGARLDTSGSLAYSDYLMNTVNQTGFTYQLSPLNKTLNYRFYVRAWVTELVLGNSKT